MSLPSSFHPNDTPSRARVQSERVTTLLLATVMLTCGAQFGNAALADSPKPAQREAASADSTALGEPSDTQGGDESPSKERSHWFPPRLQVGSVAYLPTASYDSEAGLGVGGQILRPLHSRAGVPNARTSDLGLKGEITLKGQARAALVTNLYLGAGNWFLKSKLSYDDRTRRFWGLGPDTPASAEEFYRARDLLAYIELHRRVVASLSVGVRYELEHLTYLRTEPGGLLQTQGYLGTEGKSVLGAGLVAEWDTRDRRYSPSRGVYYQASALVFDGELGSGYDFNNYFIDLRHYWGLASKHVLATQVFLYAARGEPPIWRYAALGGHSHTRGYRLGRYLDRVLVATQAEYRADVWWRLGFTAFAGLGDVASGFDQLQLQHMRPTIGGGLRARISGSNGLHARLDMAAGKNSARVQLELDEAF